MSRIRVSYTVEVSDAARRAIHESYTGTSGMADDAHMRWILMQHGMKNPELAGGVELVEKEKKVKKKK